MQIRILIIEDDDDLRGSLDTYLTGSGLLVRAISTAENLIGEIADFGPDILLLDINLPGPDGFTAAALVRERASLGVIMLTGRSMRDDRLRGLAGGADHYLVKPVDLAELEMLIRNLHRRIVAQRTARPVETATDAGKDTIKDPSKDIWGFNPKRWTLTSPPGAKVSLSAAERHVMEKLLERPGEAVSRADLVPPGSRQSLDPGRGLDLLVFRLRRKVERESGSSLPLLSARGIGYVFAGIVRRQDD